MQSHISLKTHLIIFNDRLRICMTGLPIKNSQDIWTENKDQGYRNKATEQGQVLLLWVSDWFKKHS